MVVGLWWGHFLFLLTVISYLLLSQIISKLVCLKQQMFMILLSVRNLGMTWLGVGVSGVGSQAASQSCCHLKAWVGLEGPFSCSLM